MQADDGPPVSARGLRLAWVLQRHVPAVLVACAAVAVVVAMTLSAAQMSDLRLAFPPLSRAMNWLEGLGLPLDMDHVALFVLIGFAGRLLLPRVQAWQVWLGIGVLAAGTELLQFASDGRTPKLLDVRDDMIGASVGLLVGMVPAWLAPWAAGLLAIARLLLLAGVALLPLQQWLPFEVLGFPVLASDLLFVAAILARALAWAGGAAPLALHGVRGFHGWLLAYLFALGWACTLLLPDVRVDAAGSMPMCPVATPRLDLAIAKWAGVAYLGALAVLACDLGRDVAWMRWLVLAWVAAAVVAALVSIATVAGFYLAPGAGWFEPWLSHHGSLPTGNYPRVRGLFENANMTCNYLLVALCLAWAAADSTWLPARIAAVASLLLTLAALATLSPGLGGLAIAWSVHGWTRRRATRPRMAAMLLAAGLVVAGLVLAAMWVNPVAPMEMPSVRAQIWQQAWQNWMVHPWRGIGLAMPSVGVAFVDPSGHAQWLTDAHNTWLNLGVQAGLCGALALAGMAACLLRRGVQAACRGNPVAGQASLAFAVAFVYCGLAGSFEDARHLWVLAGLLAAAAARTGSGLSRQQGAAKGDPVIRYPENDAGQGGADGGDRGNSPV